MKTKRIEWSYPTSDNAKRFGHYKSGCWTVEIVYDDTDLDPIAMAGFNELQQARRFADSLNSPYNKLTR